MVAIICCYIGVTRVSYVRIRLVSLDSSHAQNPIEVYKMKKKKLHLGSEKKKKLRPEVYVLFFFFFWNYYFFFTMRMQM